MLEGAIDDGLWLRAAIAAIGYGWAEAVLAHLVERAERGLNTGIIAAQCVVEGNKCKPVGMIVRQSAVDFCQRSEQTELNQLTAGRFI